MRTVYSGWIGAQESDRSALESMGFKVSRYNQTAMSFDLCEGSPRAMEQLKKSKWKYLYGLRATQVEEIGEDVPF